MTTKPTERDLTEEAEALLANVPEFCADAANIKHALFADAVERERVSPFWGWTTQTAIAYARFPELLRRLVAEVKRERDLRANAEEEIAQHNACDKCDLCEDHHA